MATHDFDMEIRQINGTKITGGAASTEVRLYRMSDQSYWDFNDSSWKTSGWTTITAAMSEVDATDVPGVYRYTLDYTGWADGFYHIYCDYTGVPKQGGGRDFRLYEGNFYAI